MAELRVLFVPNPGGILAHGIPLIALSRKLGKSATSAFLVPAGARAQLEAFGASVLNVDHRDLATEMTAYKRFRPDVVVDDMSLTTFYATRLRPIPRVAVVRTGSFPQRGNASGALAHSFRFQFESLAPLERLQIETPRAVAEICGGDAHIVPTIPSIEPLPNGLAPEDFFYAGPLIADDFYIGNGYARPTDARDFARLRDFVARIGTRKVVYLTLGTVAVMDPDQGVPAVISALSNSDCAVITNVRARNSTERSDLVFRADYLPMHFVCDRADVIVHHCGSGTYQYPLLHKKPAVTVWTNAFDRVDVAMRLQDLGVSTHIGDATDFADRCLAAIRRWFEVEKPDIERAYAPITKELDDTVAKFDFRGVIQRAVARRGNRSRSTSELHA